MLSRYEYYCTIKNLEMSAPTIGFQGVLLCLDRQKNFRASCVTRKYSQSAHQSRITCRIPTENVETMSQELPKPIPNLPTSAHPPKLDTAFIQRERCSTQSPRATRTTSRKSRRQDK